MTAAANRRRKAAGRNRAVCPDGSLEIVLKDLPCLMEPFGRILASTHRGFAVHSKMNFLFIQK